MAERQEELPVHPDYKHNLSRYNRVTDFLDGSKEAVVNNTYLWKHETEDDTRDGVAAWSARLLRTYNENIVAPFADIHLAHLSQPITSKALDTGPLAEIAKDITGMGWDLKTFTRELLWYYLAHGKVCVLTDNAQDVGLSLAEAAAQGVQSFSIIYPATHILYWEYFRRGARKGKLKDVILLEEATIEDGKIVKRAIRYRFADGDHYIVQHLILEDDPDTKENKHYKRESGHGMDHRKARIESEVLGSLENIPALIWGCGLEDSLLRQNVEYNHAALNLQSVITETIYNQCFRITVLVGDVPKDQLIKTASGRIWAFEGQNLTVEQIDPIEPVAAMKEVVNLKIANFKHGLMLNSQLLDDTRSVQSAESKAFDSKSRVAEYNRIADQLEKVLTQMLASHAEFEGVSLEIAVDIARDFSLTDPAADAILRSQIVAIAREQGVNEVQKEVLRSLVLAMPLVPKADQTEDERRSELLALIDAAVSPNKPGLGVFDPFANRRDSTLTQ